MREALGAVTPVSTLLAIVALLHSLPVLGSLNPEVAVGIHYIIKQNFLVTFTFILTIYFYTRGYQLYFHGIIYFKFVHFWALLKINYGLFGLIWLFANGSLRTKSLDDPVLILCWNPVCSSHYSFNKLPSHLLRTRYSLFPLFRA